MPKRIYESKRFKGDALRVVAQASEILENYAGQGFDLTLRQLYYQFVARDLFPDERTWSQTGTGKWVRDPGGTKNAEPNYKWLGTIINDARLAGYIDWDYIVDRTRNLRETTHWRNPAHIIEATARSFKVDLWERQPNYVEVWIEKDALIGVIQGVCSELDVPYFSCRGYTSQSEMWGAGQRLLEKVVEGKKVTVLHLGDHDPSGIDMTRDIEDRLAVFIATDYIRHVAAENDMPLDQWSEANIQVTGREAMERFAVSRIALTMDQIEEYDPPPNPAKVSDSRAVSYISNYGESSWELDALEPAVMADLIRTNVNDLIDDEEAWDEDQEREDDGQRLLARASRRWEELVERLSHDDDTEDEDA